MSSDAFERLAAGLYLEGLTVEPGSETVWYSDVIAGGLHRIGAAGDHTSFNDGRMWVGGLAVNHDGKILSTGAGGIQWTDPASGESGWLLREIAGEPINGINELAPDGQGGLYFGTVDLASIAQGKRPQPVGLYHFAVDGSVRKMCDGLGFTNGLALSPDGGTLYCNESFDGVYAHDVGPDLALSNRRKLLDKPDCDGLTLDENGNLWITGFVSSFIERMAPDGTLLGRFETPGSAVTQMRFGGADLLTIYLVSVPDDAGQRLARGDLPDEEISFLYRARGEVPGYLVPQISFAMGKDGING